MDIDIISKLNKQASVLAEDDVDSWVVPDLMVHYQSRIDSHAVRVYGAGLANVAKSAFRETAKATIRNGLMTFLFKSQHWKSGRDVNTYLLTCLKRLADQVYWDQSSAKRANLLICPACREIGTKVFLVAEAKNWRCPNCTSEMDRIQDDIKKESVTGTELFSMKMRAKLHKAFALHSRRGLRCLEPDCARFIPETLNGKFGIECPYPDCSFFGAAETLEPMSHPSALTHRQMVSLNQPLAGLGDKGGATISLQDTFKAELVSPDEKISITQSFAKEFSILINVIDTQILSVKRMNGNGTRTQKLLMYEAFKSMCYKYPDEMVSYLCHLKQSADVPIQARIFQEYISLMENALPFTIERRGDKIDILSISDPYLGLFTGLSTFEAIVDSQGKIPNNTIETYVGSRKYKMYGSCFIGKLISVLDKESGETLTNRIKSYSFVDIQSDLAPGTNVIVNHYRIPPHYEMGGLVFLQRIRRHLVDKIFYRLNGKKRSIGRSDTKSKFKFLCG